MKKQLIWLVPLVIYGLFWFGYTNLDGPLTAQEIRHYRALLASRNAGPEGLAAIETFMRADTGDQFLMVNLLLLNGSPPDLEATGPNAEPADLLNHYMAHMFPALLSRASHPILTGQAVNRALDITGISGAEVWHQFALVRYRSRRDLMEIVTDPRFNDRHEYKIAALTKMIAFPIEPVLYYSDPRWWLALVMLCITLLLKVWWQRNR